MRCDVLWVTISDDGDEEHDLCRRGKKQGTKTTTLTALALAFEPGLVAAPDRWP